MSRKGLRGCLFLMAQAEADEAVVGFAEGVAGVAVGKEVGDGGAGEFRLDHGHGFIDAAMEGAEFCAMGFEAERAVGDAGHGIDGVEDVEDGDGLGVGLE